MPAELFGLRGYELGAVLVTLLALPKADDETKRELKRSLCRVALETHLGPGTLEYEQEVPMRPCYAFRDMKLVERDLRKIKRQLRDRMEAAHIAMAFLKQAQGYPVELPEGVPHLSLNKLSEFMLSRRPNGTEKGDGGNFENRVWRESLPVIHFAVAVAALADGVEREGGRINLGHLLTDRAVVEAVIELSNFFAVQIEQGALPGKIPKLSKLALG